MITLLGWLAAVVDIAQFSPQALHTLRQRANHVALGGLSVTAYSIATLQSVLWVIYGFATDRLPVALPNLVIAPLCALILALAWRARRLRARSG